MDRVIFSSKNTVWGTPPELFKLLDREFHFNLDPCALPENAKCEKYFTPETDGLKQNWKNHRVFCNPPYGKDIAKWVKKCACEAQKGRTKVVLLIPARTDTTYFHEHIYRKVKEIRFIRGRLRFTNIKGEKLGSAPFPSMVVVF